MYNLLALTLKLRELLKYDESNKRNIFEKSRRGRCELGHACNSVLKHGSIPWVSYYNVIIKIKT